MGRCCHRSPTSSDGKTVLQRRQARSTSHDDDLEHRSHALDCRLLGFVAKTSIDRKDFGLQWNQVLEAGGVLVGDRVDIELDVQAVNTAARDAAA